MSTRQAASVDDKAAEARDRQRAKRQALMLMVASGLLTIALLIATWLALRKLL
jgi:hypothetical protein